MPADVLEPGEVPVPTDEAPVAVAPPPPLPERAFKDTCQTCYRPVVEIEGTWKHWDPRIDEPTSPAYHAAVLYDPPPTRWGFLNVKGKSDFSIDQGPSKVHSGWSGGGVA